MLINDLIHSSGFIGSVVKFTKDMDESADKDMIARVVGSRQINMDVVEIYMDFNEFMEHNTAVGKKDWYDSTGIARLNWFEACHREDFTKMPVYFDKSIEYEPFFGIINADTSEIDHALEVVRRHGYVCLPRISDNEHASLPAWLQDLWEECPRIAREAEKYIKGES